MKSKEQKIIDAAHSVESEIETLVMRHLGEERWDIVQAISDALLLLQSEVNRLDWLLGGQHGAVKYVRLSPIDEDYDERILVNSRNDIDAEINSQNAEM